MKGANLLKIGSFYGIIDNMKNDKKVLIIAEDNINAKLRFLMEDVKKNNINHIITDNLEDTIDAVEENRENADIVILDCGLPRKKGEDSTFYGGIEIIHKLIRWNNDISIILNTPATIPYDALPQENVIYVCRTHTWISRIMENKVRNNQRLYNVMNMLRKNNNRITPDKAERYVVTEDFDR